MNTQEKKLLKNTFPIIALVGMCGSGKSSVADLLSARGYKGVYFGGIALQEVKQRGWKITPENERIVREELREKEGMDVFASRSVEKISKLHNEGENVFIDGLYSYQEYLLLKKVFPRQLVVVEVYADKKVRQQRLANRAVRPLTKNEAEQRDRMEVEKLDKAPPIALCDYKLENNKTSEFLEKTLQQLLARI